MTLPSNTGTDEKRKALFRACFCISGFYRLDRFGHCKKCPNKGFTCNDESLNLAMGFFWTWELFQQQNNSSDIGQMSEEHFRFSLSTYRKTSYINFTTNIKTTDGSHDINFNQFQEMWIPLAYACPIYAACIGGINSECASGYEGPLCAVCSSGYHCLISRCNKCPTTAWIVIQLVITALTFAIFVALIMKDRKKNKDQRSITDIVLARAKIVITFYQITSISVESFSYIQWPSAMIKLQQYVKLIQLNLFQIAHVHCFKYTLRINSQNRVIFYICLNVVTVLAVVLYFHLRKAYLKRQQLITQYQLNMSLSKLKERCWRNVFLILFVIYPSTSLEILQILPFACHKLCSFKESTSCNRYLKADYTINCDSENYKKNIPFFYLSPSYVIFFPMVMLALLFKYTRTTTENSAKETKNQHGDEIQKGLSFLYENYTPNCWFWEMIEIGRKLLFTLAIVLANTESRSYLALLVITSGLYAVLVTSYKPISDTFEYWLQLASLMASLANLIVGMLLKIEVIDSAIVKETDSAAVTVLMVAANVSVIAIVAGETLIQYSSCSSFHPRSS